MSNPPTIVGFRPRVIEAQKKPQETPADILQYIAANQPLTDVLVIGWDETGSLYYGHTESTVPDLLYMLKKTAEAIDAD